MHITLAGFNDRRERTAMIGLCYAIGVHVETYWLSFTYARILPLGPKRTQKNITVFKFNFSGNQILHILKINMKLEYSLVYYDYYVFISCFFQST